MDKGNIYLEVMNLKHARLFFFPSYIICKVSGEDRAELNPATSKVFPREH